jgi:hypothetical protein
MIGCGTDQPTLLRCDEVELLSIRKRFTSSGGALESPSARVRLRFRADGRRQTVGPGNRAEVPRAGDEWSNPEGDRGEGRAHEAGDDDEVEAMEGVVEEPHARQ